MIAFFEGHNRQSTGVSGPYPPWFQKKHTHTHTGSRGFQFAASLIMILPSLVYTSAHNHVCSHDIQRPVDIKRVEKDLKDARACAVRFCFCIKQRGASTTSCSMGGSPISVFVCICKSKFMFLDCHLPCPMLLCCLFGIGHDIDTTPSTVSIADCQRLYFFVFGDGT